VAPGHVHLIRLEAERVVDAIAPSFKAHRSIKISQPSLTHSAARGTPPPSGGINVGKTNLDQFASGLVGTRTPYGVAPNAFDSRFIPGGSSSGSAAAVGARLVTFALGTDTAGSGRVPAGYNGIVGIKPTVGSVSSVGVVPACATLDCLTVFAGSVEDAAEVAAIMRSADAGAQDVRRRTPAPIRPPPASKAPFRFAVPSAEFLEWDGAGASGVGAAWSTCFGINPFPQAAQQNPLLAAAVNPSTTCLKNITVSPLIQLALTWLRPAQKSLRRL
jgi:hypothetical protein